MRMSVDYGHDQRDLGVKAEIGKNSPIPKSDTNDAEIKDINSTDGVIQAESLTVPQIESKNGLTADHEKTSNIESTSQPITSTPEIIEEPLPQDVPLENKVNDRYMA